jgi:hypothetical protein
VSRLRLGAVHPWWGGARQPSVIRGPEWKDDFDNARQERTLAAVACTLLTQPYNGKELLSVVGLPSLPPWEPFLTRC